MLFQEFIHLMSKTRILTAVLPHMIACKSGHIVAVSSIQGRIALPFRYIYHLQS